jgi:GST-like protein
MIDLYYWPTSNGRKITIMLHEVALPYTIIPVNFKTGEQYAAEYLAINPNSKIPAIVDHEPIGAVCRSRCSSRSRSWSISPRRAAI